MKKKVSVSLIIALVMTLILVSGVLAGSIGNIDGVWQYVEDNTNPASNAYCVAYGTGNGTSVLAADISRNNPSIQTGPTTDENQVHYGKPGIDAYNDLDCPTGAPDENWFDLQSGLGFDGNNSVGIVPADQTFLVGRLTHYNRPIRLNDDNSAPPAGSWRFMQWIDLDLNVSGVMCTGPNNTLVPPVEGTTFTFTYRINFEETPNSCSVISNPCAFGDACPPWGCSDRVTVGQAPPATSFTCGTNADPLVQGIYTLVLDGFKSNGTSTTCPATASAPYQTQYITAENAQNNACLYGKVTGFVPAAVTLKDFSAAIVDDGVLLHWETLSEVNTLGFNLYRSESLEAEKVLVNSGLIMSNLAPGSLGGALYQHLDKANAAEAYYWLEEIEADGTATSYGWTLAR